MTTYKKLSLMLALCALAALPACSSLPQTPAEQAEARAIDDPLESVNRTIFDVNDFLDRLLLRPLAELYRVTVPPMLRDRITGIVNNMSEPVIFANNLLQGEVRNAGTTFGRFVVNTTAGGAGMFEVANGLGLQKQTGDFGQTLHVWGADSGPYLVLPLFGPSNFRDAIGLGVDTLISPWKYLAAMGGNGVYNRFSYSDFAASGLTRREENIEALDTLREGSLDFYAQMRSVYRQHRAKKLGIEMTSDMPEFEDYEADRSAPIVH